MLGEKGVSACLMGPGSSPSPTLSPETTGIIAVKPEIIMANALSNSLVSSTRPGLDLMGVGGRGARRDDLQTGHPGELPWPGRP